MAGTLFLCCTIKTGGENAKDGYKPPGHVV